MKINLENINFLLGILYTQLLKYLLLKKVYQSKMRKKIFDISKSLYLINLFFL